MFVVLGQIPSESNAKWIPNSANRRVEDKYRQTAITNLGYVNITSSLLLEFRKNVTALPCNHTLRVIWMLESIALMADALS